MPSGCSQDLLERFICTLLWRTQPDARSDGIFSVAKLETWLSSWPEVQLHGSCCIVNFGYSFRQSVFP